jgi:glutathione S-transferase
MSAFIIHGAPGSPYGRAVLAALEEKAMPYRFVPVALGAHRAPAHLARHPFGKVPVMEHGDFTLYETQAILRYIERVIPQPALSPPDCRAAARMDQLMNINDWYLFQGVANVIAFQRIIAPRLLGTNADEAAIAAAMPRAHVVFDELALQLGEKPFFVHDAVSLADIMIAPHLDFLRATPEWQLLAGPHANLDRWLDRMNGRPSMAATTWERVTAMARAA